MQCPSCKKNFIPEIYCDNDCGTITCNRCNEDLYFLHEDMSGNIITQGHNPECNDKKYLSYDFHCLKCGYLNSNMIWICENEEQCRSFDCSACFTEHHYNDEDKVVIDHNPKCETLLREI